MFDFCYVYLGKEELPSLLHFASCVLFLLMKACDYLPMSIGVEFLVQEVNDLANERNAVGCISAYLGVLIEDLNELLERVLDELVLSARNLKRFPVQKAHDKGVGLVEFGPLATW